MDANIFSVEAHVSYGFRREKIYLLLGTLQGNS